MTLGSSQDDFFKMQFRPVPSQEKPAHCLLSKQNWAQPSMVSNVDEMNACPGQFPFIGMKNEIAGAFPVKTRYKEM